MASKTASTGGGGDAPTPVKAVATASKQLAPINLLIGAGVSLFEVTTLGQPFEVLKTQMAANREQGFGDAVRSVWARGGVRGFYQGLIPWVRSRFTSLQPLLLTWRNRLGSSPHQPARYCSSRPQNSRLSRWTSLGCPSRRPV